MAKTYTHPHWETYVIDKSIYVPLNNEILPLFRPIFFCRTQKGPAGVPIWCDGLESAYKNFGEGTFDQNTKYFSREALYMSSIFNRQGCFITRMVSADAKYASLVLELRVKKTKITQYQKNSAGQFILDANTGKRVPLIENGLPVTEPGLELKWQVRKLEMGGIKKESITNLKPTTYGTGASAYTVYPILAVRANYVGEYANGIGFKLFVDYENSDDVMMGNLGCIPYMFGLVQKTYGQDTVTAILSAFQNQYETVVLKPNQVDQRVVKNVSFADVVGNEFNGVMPFSVNLYSENIEIIGRLAMDVEKDDDTVFDPHMINLADLTNPEGVAYSHLVMSTEDDAIYLNDTRIMYLQGGEDGSISDSDIESLTSDYLLSGSVYPELMEQPRYPFTHIVDTGVSIQTKRAFIRFLGKHDAFKLILATQDANMGRLNTKAEDLSVGSALYAACLLQPESSVRGTECCRAEIYQQAGYAADSPYRGIVPSTLDIIIKKSQWQSTQSIMGQAAGLPHSKVTAIKNWNWTPCDADHRQRAWDSGLNYFQYYDMQNVHWPAMRTVYRYDTSVLTSALFTDVIVYCKHLARQNWAIYAGMELEFSVLAVRATKSLSNDLATMLNGFFNYTVDFYQTDEEARIGYISHALVKLYGNPQQRVWKIDIECYRNGYNQEEVA